jgi:predicted Zn-dependent protease
MSERLKLMKNIFSILKKELNRSFKSLKFKDNPTPFFISYLYRKADNWNIWGKYGDIFENYFDSKSGIYVEVRIGDNSFDNTTNGGLYNNSTKEDSFNWIAGPVKVENQGLVHTLWHITDCKYKEALMEYYKKKSQMIKEILIHKAPLDFSREEPYVHKENLSPLKTDIKCWEKLIKKYTKYFLKYKKIINSYIAINARDIDCYYVNTEGSDIITREQIMGIRIVAQAHAKDGMFLEKTWEEMFTGLEDFPSDEIIEEKIDKVIDEIHQLINAEVLKPYAGPAILYPSAAGIFFHEAIGHRLEGERLLSPGEGQTFKGKIDKLILPEFISIYDDPTLKEFNGKKLAGYYLYDNEGIPGQRVTLIEKGILKNFLLSRAVADNFTKSNGHARSAYHEDPIARMSNLIIKSSIEYEIEKLKEMLVKEIEEQGKEFGLIIKEAKSGETNTNRYNFQAFKGQPTMVYKVDPVSGKETLVRGTEFIGTPLTSVQKVIASGKDYEAVNAFCGAESGIVPVSTIAPAILIREVEMQRGDEINLQPQILPPPWYRK